MGIATPDLTPPADLTLPADGSSMPGFDTVRRGYDPGQVRGYCRQVGDRVQMLETTVRQLRSELEETGRQRDAALASAAAGSDPFENTSARLADLMRTFDADVERLREEAQAEADRIIVEARVEGERARVEADRTMWHLTARQEAARKEITAIRDHLLKSAQDLEAVLETDPAGRVVVLEEADEDRISEQL